MERKETILVGLLLTAELHSCGTTFPQARNQEASPAPWCHHLTCPGAGPHGPRAAPHHLLPTLPLPCLGLHGFSPCYCCPKFILHLLFSLLGLEMTSQAWKGWAQVGAAGCCCCAPLEHKCSHSSAQQRSVWGGLCLPGLCSSQAHWRRPVLPLQAAMAMLMLTYTRQKGCLVMLQFLDTFTWM